MNESNRINNWSRTRCDWNFLKFKISEKIIFSKKIFSPNTLSNNININININSSVRTYSTILYFTVMIFIHSYRNDLFVFGLKTKTKP
jgi:hypothetical protein